MLDDDDEEEFWGPIADPKEGLGPEIPSVRIPDASGGLDSDVSKEVFTTFWGLVVTLNLALFATSLGLMLAYFRGQLRLGGGLFLLGVLAFAYSYYKYQRYLGRKSRNDESDENDEEGTNDGAEEATEPVGTPGAASEREDDS